MPLASVAPAGKIASASKQERNTGANPGRLLLVVSVGLLIWALPRPTDVNPRAWVEPAL